MERNSAIGARKLELLAVQSACTTRVAKQVAIRARVAPPTAQFGVGDYVVIAYGLAWNSTITWPTFKSRYYSPCQVVRLRHLRCALTSPHGRHSRKDSHRLRLVRFLSRPYSLK